MNIIWLPLLVAWAVKLLILRYGGLKLYRDSLPFFLGLILGEFVVESLWTLIDIGLSIRSYGFWLAVHHRQSTSFDNNSAFAKRYPKPRTV
jgi:hypothetical protein